MSSEGSPKVTMELQDGGGGEYIVLHAEHWAMDSEEEIDLLAAELKAMLKGARR
jgi:hypothetical protein